MIRLVQRPLIALVATAAFALPSTAAAQYYGGYDYYDPYGYGSGYGNTGYTNYDYYDYGYGYSYPYYGSYYTRGSNWWNWW